MSSPRKRDSYRSNAIAMLGSQLVTWTFAIATFTIIPRYLGPEGVGQWSLAISLAMIGSVVGGVGVHFLMLREVARDPARAAELLPTAVALLLALGTFAGGAMWLGAWLAGYPHTTVMVVAATAASVPFLLLQQLGTSVIQGLERMRFQAAIEITGRGITLAAMLAIVAAGLGVVELALVATVGWLAMGGAAMGIAIATLPKLRNRFSLRDARYLVMSGMPFWTIGLFLVVYNAIDVVLLSQLSGETAVGIYSAPLRILGTLLFVPSIVTTVTFPQMAAHQRDDPERTARIAQGGLWLVMSVTLPLTLGVVGAGGDMLVLLIGDSFADSGAVLPMLAIALLPMSLSIVINRTLIAADRERRWTGIVTVAVAIKIGLNLLLIPLFAARFDNPALGAATSLAVIELGIVVAAAAQLPRGIWTREELRRYGRLLLVGGVAGVIMLATAVGGPDLFALPGIVGGLAYIAGAALLRVHTVEELRQAARLALGRPQPVAAEAEAA